jgi:hypothetical protein
MTSKVALSTLQIFIGSIAFANFRLTPDKVSLHSMRSASAMAMLLNGVPTYTIMSWVIGRVMLSFVTSVNKWKPLDMMWQQR